jgi:hypothetical protein
MMIALIEEPQAEQWEHTTDSHVNGVVCESCQTVYLGRPGYVVICMKTHTARGKLRTRGNYSGLPVELDCRTGEQLGLTPLNTPARRDAWNRFRQRAITNYSNTLAQQAAEQERATLNLQQEIA